MYVVLRENNKNESDESSKKNLIQNAWLWHQPSSSSSSITQIEINQIKNLTKIFEKKCYEFMFVKQQQQHFCLERKKKFIG